MFYSEQHGQSEKFRPYGLPESDWLEWVKEHLREGVNVIAIEGHNQAKDSSDYFISPTIEKHWPTVWKGFPEDADEVIPLQAEWEFLIGRACSPKMRP